MPIPMSGSPRAPGGTIRAELNDFHKERPSPSPPAPSPRGEGVKNAGWIAVLLVVLPLFGVDLMLSSMPVFGRELGAGATATQATLSVFALGFALMHLILGPLADRYGRRPCLIAGLVLFTGASVACALAASVEALIARASCRRSAPGRDRSWHAR